MKPHLIPLALPAAVLSLAFHSAAHSQPEAPPAPPPNPQANPQAQMLRMGQAMVQQLRQIEGCLAAEAGTFTGNRFVIMAWFENKAAALRCVEHPMHQRLQAGSGLPPATSPWTASPTTSPSSPSPP